MMAIAMSTGSTEPLATAIKIGSATSASIAPP